MTKRTVWSKFAFKKSVWCDPVKRCNHLCINELKRKSRRDFMDEKNIRLIEPQQFGIGLSVWSSIYPVSNSNSSQYSVSYASFRLWNKIFCSLCILRFVNIRSDRRTASKQLVRQHGFTVFLFDGFAKNYDLFSKRFGFIAENAVSHCNHLEWSICFLVVLPTMTAVILSLRDSYISR